MERLYGCSARCAVRKITLTGMIKVETNQMKPKQVKKNKKTNQIKTNTLIEEREPG